MTKPQHGVLPTDERQAQTVLLRVPFAVQRSSEWLTEIDLRWESANPGSAIRLTIPAGAVRFMAIHPLS